MEKNMIWSNFLLEFQANIWDDPFKTYVKLLEKFYLRTKSMIPDVISKWCVSYFSYNDLFVFQNDSI